MKNTFNYIDDDIPFEDNLTEGKDFYLENGYRVMTAEYLTRRGILLCQRMQALSLLAQSAKREYKAKIIDK
jgi:hypothetical protein